MNKNVLEWLEKTAAVFPSKTAYESEHTALTFQEVQDLSKRIGSGIVNAGISAGPVAVFLEKEVNTIPAFLGVAYSGRAYAPIDASLPAERVEKILEVLSPALLIVDDSSSAKVAGLCHAPVLHICQLLQAEIEDEKLLEIRDSMVETDPLYIIFTSGSSGVPKGVITSHRSLMCYIDAYVKVMGIDSTDRIANQSPLDYIAAIRDIYVPLYTGAYTFLIEKKYFMRTDTLSEIIQKQKITSIGWSTASLTLLASLGLLESNRIQSIQKICFSGSVMSGTVLRKWQLALPNAKFVNQYGPTEATASCTYYVADHVVTEDEIIPIGKAYNNYHVFIVKEDGTEAAENELGEIYVSGPILALGYYHNLSKTMEDFIQNPTHCNYFERCYKTGDIGLKRPDGNLEYHGRKDRQIKHMGHRVELDEIDSACQAIPGVSECVSVYHQEKETICLFYSGTVGSKEIVLALRKSLPGFMIPRKITCLESLPKLHNGKLDIVTLKQSL